MLKHKRTQAQSCFTNELHEALMDKDYSSFWRSWNAKFGHAISSQVINGTSDHGSIAEAFGDIFDACCQPNNNMAHDRLKQQFEHMYDGYCGAAFDVESSINVELVDRAIRDLKLGRAAGPDGICAEHLVYCHPLVCVLLSLLFRLMFMYRYVPDSFGLGMISPLLKGDNCNRTVAENYRAITISPCVSKVFGLSSMFHESLRSEDLQFGFKKGRGCRDAIYTLRGIVGSAAMLCALDISKAFDKMSHPVLYIKLMQRNIPKCFLDVLINWYSKSYAFVRWGSFVSRVFLISAGVRQGGVLSLVSLLFLWIL